MSGRQAMSLGSTTALLSAVSLYIGVDLSPSEAQLPQPCPAGCSSKTSYLTWIQVLVPTLQCHIRSLASKLALLLAQTRQRQISRELGAPLAYFSTILVITSNRSSKLVQSHRIDNKLTILLRASQRLPEEHAIQVEGILYERRTRRCQTHFGS